MRSSRVRMSDSDMVIKYSMYSLSVTSISAASRSPVFGSAKDKGLELGRSSSRSV